MRWVAFTRDLKRELFAAAQKSLNQDFSKFIKEREEEDADGGDNDDASTGTKLPDTGPFLQPVQHYLFIQRKMLIP